MVSIAPLLLPAVLTVVLEAAPSPFEHRRKALFPCKCIGASATKVVSLTPSQPSCEGLGSFVRVVRSGGRGFTGVLVKRGVGGRPATFDELLRDCVGVVGVDRRLHARAGRRELP